MSKLGTICALVIAALTSGEGCTTQEELDRQNRLEHARKLELERVEEYSADQKFRELWFDKDIRTYEQWTDALGIERTLPEKYNKWMAWINVRGACGAEQIVRDDYVQIYIPLRGSTEALRNAVHYSKTPEEREADRKLREELESGKLPPGGY
jgi:hypothetical protein